MSRKKGVSALGAVRPRDICFNALMAYFSGFAYLLASGFSGGKLAVSSGESSVYMAWAALTYGLLLAALLVRWRQVLLLVTIRKSLIALFLLAGVLSYLSLHPEGGVVYEKFVMFALTLLFGAWLSITFSPEELFDRLFWFSIFVLLFHWAIWFHFGNVLDYDALNRKTLLGTSPYAGAFGHRILAGAFFGISFIVAFLRGLAPQNRRRRLFHGAVAAGHLITLLASGSAGQFLATVAVTCTIFMVRLMGKASFKYILVVFIGSIVAFYLLPSLFSSLLGAIGRDTTLTGRNFFSNAWPSFFSERPWFGYGYGNFFGNSAHSPDIQLSLLSPWHNRFSSFENSYLEMLIDFGVIGASCFFLILINGGMNAYRYASKHDNGGYEFASIAVFVFIFMSGFGEAFLTLHSFLLASFVVCFYCGLTTREPLRTAKWGTRFYVSARYGNRMASKSWRERRPRSAIR